MTKDQIRQTKEYIENQTYKKLLRLFFREDKYSLFY